MAFAMLYHAKKPKSWWDYTFDWALYILDRCPRRSNINCITPFEAFFGVKPDLQDVRMFGCVCYALVHPPDHLHLERRGYRVVLDGAKKFTVARSVTFYEQSLVDAMIINMGARLSDSSTFRTVPTATSIQSSVSEGVRDLVFREQSPPGI